MRYIEDDFDLDQFKRSFRQKFIVEVSPGNKILNGVVSAAVWLASLAVAFVLAYFLFRGGQYLIDLVR